MSETETCSNCDGTGLVHWHYSVKKGSSYRAGPTPTDEDVNEPCGACDATGRLAARPAAPEGGLREGAVTALAAYQQADEDGILVLVSRQAIDECLPTLRAALTAQSGEAEPRPVATASAMTLARSILAAETALSEHLDEFHDFEYEPHLVPSEVQSLRDICDQLAASLIDSDGKNFPTQSPQDSGWQTMDSAPKDGTRVLLFGHVAGEINKPSDARVGRAIGSYSSGNTDYPGFDWDIEPTDAYNMWVKPTRWMPLPPPPANQQGG